MNRTLTIFSIREGAQVTLNLALTHQPLAQDEIELRLRLVAKKFGETFAAFALHFEDDKLREEIIVEFEEHGLVLVRDNVFFQIDGAVRLRAKPQKHDGLLDDLAVAAVEPTDDAARIAELVSYVTEELGRDRERLTEDLDESVHDCKGSEAADINNSGLEDQINYLCRGMSLDTAKKWLKDNCSA